MKQLLFFFLLLAVLAACSAKDDSLEATAPDGPALIMFYTDN